MYFTTVELLASLSSHSRLKSASQDTEKTEITMEDTLS